MRLVITILFLASLVEANATNYFVTKAGNDSNPGTQASPWLTVQKAANTATTGDIVDISSGVYSEYVDTANNGVWFRNNATNVQWTAEVTQFRLKNVGTILAGLKIRKGNNINNALIRIEGPGAVNNGSSFIITNCYIGDIVAVGSHSLIFSNSYIQSTGAFDYGGDFNQAGFAAGMTITPWADSLSLFTNHGVTFTVSSVSGDGKTLFLTSPVTADAGSNYWGTIVAGTDNSTYKCILMVLASSSGPTNGLIAWNLFTNWQGPVIITSGDNHSIVSNHITAARGQYGIQANSSNTKILWNLFDNNKNIEFWTPDELNGAAHPLGGGLYDWQCNYLAIFQHGSSNIDIGYNAFFNNDNQLMQLQEPDTGITDINNINVFSNLFLGYIQHGSFRANNMKFNHNTFGYIGYQIGESTALGGVFSTVGGQICTNPMVINNIFFNIGEHAIPANETPYQLSVDITQQTNSIASNNFSTFPETMGWSNTPTMTGVIVTNADPLFVNIMQPFGPDGIPFTADDGLRVLPNSPAAGLGALLPLPFTAQQSIAHFKVVRTINSWNSTTGTNYDTVWAALKPPDRPGPIRPWQRPEALGQYPTNVIFDASQSIGGLYTNGVGNYLFGWNFGDGATALTPRPIVNHTYTQAGTNVVTLIVTNLYGGISTYSNAYVILSSSVSVVRYVTITGNDSTGDGLTVATAWRTIQKAATSASANWTIDVGPGNFGELVDCTQTAGTGRIKFVGHNSRTGGFNLRNSFYTIEGFELDGTGVGTFAGLLYCYAATTNIYAYNNYGHNVTNIYFVEMPMTGGATPGFGSQFDFFSNNVAKKIHGPCFDLHGNGHTVTANIEQDSESEGDFIRLFGANHFITYNYCTNLSAYGGGGHADFVQTFGDSTSGQFFGATNCWIIGNVDVGNVNTGADPIGAGANGSQICQFEHDDNATTFTAPYTNIYFINNIFAYISYAANVDLDGTKWYNNLFYKVNGTNASPVFAFGGTKGSAFGTVMRNNSFIGCGSGNQFYPNVGDVTSNWDLDADYDYAGTVTGGAAASSWQTQGREVHGISGGDPKLVSVANNDFHLNTSSPLIATAQSQSSLFTTDNDQLNRATTWDIGPLAFTTGAAPTPPPPTTNSILNLLNIGNNSKGFINGQLQF